MEDNQIKIDTGFDRGLDYIEIKNALLNDINNKCEQLKSLPLDIKGYISKKRILTNQIIYILLALIQLKNGSRSIEAVWAFREFIKNRNLKGTICVKIAKSESTKYDRKTKEKYISKKRYRKMVYPITWISFDKKMLNEIDLYAKNISDNRIKKRTLDYLLTYHECNTHSLRYCFINYMINEMKVPLNDVSKTVGHVDLSMLTRYTQSKNVDKVLAMD